MTSGQGNNDAFPPPLGQHSESFWLAVAFGSEQVRWGPAPQRPSKIEGRFCWAIDSRRSLCLSFKSVVERLSRTHGWALLRNGHRQNMDLIIFGKGNGLSAGRQIQSELGRA